MFGVRSNWRRRSSQTLLRQREADPGLSVSNKKRTEAITGKISANPNPISFGQGCVVISWETNDPGGAEVRISTSPGDEKLVSQSKGQSGQTEIPWIVDSTIYDFRLYAASQPDTPVDSVQVRRDLDSAPMALRELADEVLRGNIDMAELSRFVATVIPVCLRSANFRGFFPVVLRELAVMRETIDIMELSQFIATVMPHCLHSGKFQEIFLVWERHGFHVTPVHFYQPIPDTQSLPETLWNRPSKLVGIEMNDSVQLDLLRNCFPKFRVEYVDLEFFSQLDSGDILFIDSSHTVRIGGDVNYLFLKVLPRLKPGVIVHIHDIFLPFEYRRDWVMDEFRFWTEQYLLQAFLTFNSEFEVLMGNGYLGHYHMEDLKATFPISPWWGGVSFWIRRQPLRRD